MGIENDTQRDGEKQTTQIDRYRKRYPGNKREPLRVLGIENDACMMERRELHKLIGIENDTRL